MVHCVTQQQPVASRPGLALRVGVGCANPELTLDSFSAPHTGRTMMFGIRGVPTSTSLAAMLIGAPQATPLSSIGMENCWLYTSGIAAIPVAYSAAAGSGSARLAIPDEPNVVGALLSLQLAAVAPGSTSLGAVTSNGISFTIAQ